MAHQLTWVVPHRVLLATQKGIIAAEESQNMAHHVYNSIDSDPDAMIHVLIDGREATLRDKLWNYTKLDLKRHPRCDFIIIIGDSRVTGLLIALISNLLNLQMHYNATPESAMKFLQERDEQVAEHLA